MKEKKILSALDATDDVFLEEARAERRQALPFGRLAIAASILLVVAGVLGFTLLGGGTVTPPENNNPQGSDIPARDPFGEGGDYSRLIAVIEKFKEKVGGYPPPVGDDGKDEDIPTSPGDAGTGINGINPPPPSGDNGEIIENTDNQVEGVIEGDLMKMTDKYIFRLGYESDDTFSNKLWYLRVYSVDKENSKLITSYKLPLFDNEEDRKAVPKMEIYLSKDAKTLTLIRSYLYRNDKDYKSTALGIMSFDISDVNNITERARMSVNGIYRSSRMVDGNLMLFTEKTFYLGFLGSGIDYSDYSRYLPSVYIEGEWKYIGPEYISMPDEITSVNYTTLLMLEEDGLEIVDARAFLDYTDDIYVSENNIFITREYSGEPKSVENVEIREALSDIAITEYKNGVLTDKGSVTVRGDAKDQYSFDERDGHLRVVTTTSYYEIEKQYILNSRIKNASLFVIDLSNNSIIASVEDFAPDGEEAASVRFEGDKLYVCTAVVRLFSDPVFFFDLSDYANITYSDTGYIEGFSSSLIDLGEGYLLGVGNEDRFTRKIEVYKRDGDQVVSVDKFLTFGNISSDYKAYFVDRESNLFGLGLYHLYNESTGKMDNCYYLFQFDGSKLCLIESVIIDDTDAFEERAAMVDGYLYITTSNSFTVVKPNIE